MSCIAESRSRFSTHIQSNTKLRLDCGYRVDLLVENQLIVELKSVEAITGIHEAQLLTSMKLAGVKFGLLINFNTTWLNDGIKRFVL